MYYPIWMVLDMRRAGSMRKMSKFSAITELKLRPVELRAWFSIDIYSFRGDIVVSNST